MRDVYIVGVGMTPFGRHLDKSHADLTQASVREALNDAGATASQLGMAIYANVSQGVMANELSVPGEFALRPLGIEGVQVMHVEAACASATIGVHVAWNYIRAGIADVVLIVGTEKLYSEDREKRLAIFQQPLDAVVAREYLERTKDKIAPLPPGIEGPGPNLMMECYAAQARLHMATYGTTAEQIAAVAAKDHVHSVHNPLSQYRKAMTIEEVLAAPVVSWPLTNPMCAPISDGSAAAVLCAGDVLDSFPDARPIRILGAANMSGTERAPDDYANHVTRRTAKLVYEMAGIGPEDVSVAEVHDASSIGEILQIEGLGLCAPGDGGPAALAGEFSLGGRVPVNTSGGLVSKGHPLGATGLGIIHELVTQLRGDAGARQVEGARIAIAENSGGFYGVEDGLSSVTMLGRH
jgi:acetyl-CoA acyltransferase